ncbi:alanine racemase [Pilimelia anulata]|uniref:Alanine racemase n=1 Tax=Pilimelia anulata TaxID=53371 RepID=A0A8J3BA70_9ACTN|nr:alanine racemase [Pilimelia anulata]GGJ99082.1 alanine racemase [Pilimelia anulata]
MWQAEVRVDLAAIRDNVARLRAGTAAELMAVVKADGYGHGAVPSARAALAGGATWLGVCTLGEAADLRAAGITARVLAWLTAPDADFAPAIAADVDLSASSLEQLAAIAAAAGPAGRPARLHLKADTGLARAGAPAGAWPALVEAAAKHAAAGAVEIVGVWSHLVYADVPDHPTTDRQLAAFRGALDVAERHGVRPPLRHLANSAATLARPDAHFDLVRPGLACYGLSPIPGAGHGLRPAMTARARVLLTKRVPAGTGVAYGHTYVTDRETTLALLPLGYADGVPRAASNAGPVRLAGRVRTIAGRVSMDQIVVDCGDDPVAPGDEATLFGPDGPTADDWAAAADTINYEIVARFGSPRVPRTYVGLDA